MAGGSVSHVILPNASSRIGVQDVGAPISFANAAPTRWQYFVAYGVVLLLVALALAVVPYVRLEGPYIPALMAFYQSAVILASFVTAVLLFILYREMAQADLLVLGSGYLFFGVMCFTHFLSFPGLLAPNGLLRGNDQTAPAIWMAMHCAFPVAVMLSMYLRSRGARNIDWLTSLFMALLIVVVLVVLIVASTTMWSDWLPVLNSESDPNAVRHVFWPILVVVNLAAAAILGLNMDRHSILTLWLFVGMVAFSMEVMVAWQTDHPFSAGWYASRILGFVGSTVLAGIFIIENALLLRNSGKLARELQKALLDSQAATLSKSRFFAAASHDLRQPFQAMRLFYGVLEQSKTDAHQEVVLEHLGQAMNNAEVLLNELLDIARIESKSLVINLQPVDIRALVDEIVSDLLPVAEQRHLTIKARGPTITVTTDRALLKRILLNLAANAIRYTEKGGVLVAIRNKHDRDIIEVWDTGIGISKEDTVKVFEEFYQSANPSRDRTQGTGLGLAIVARLSAALGCEIELASKLGKGSCFTIKLPIPKPPPEKIECEFSSMIN